MEYFLFDFIVKKHSGKIVVAQKVNVEHSELDYNTLRTKRGKSYYGLNDRNIGSQFAVDYHSEYQQFKLIKKEYYNHDTMKFMSMISIKFKGTLVLFTLRNNV